MPKRMTKYEELMEESPELTIKERPLRHSDGLTKGKKIYIRSSQTSIEKACVLAEEIAHAQFTVGCILDQGDTGNRKQELFARAKAYDRLIGLTGLIEAHKHGCQSRYEAAEFLEVTEEFLEEAVDRYRNKYGLYAKCGKYLVVFEPTLAVIEFF